MDRLGSITVQRCQNSAPAGFKLCVSGGSITVNMEPSPNSFVSGLIRKVAERRAKLPDGFAALSRTGAVVRRRARYPLEDREQQNSLSKLDRGGKVKSGTAVGDPDHRAASFTVASLMFILLAVSE
jgi:hypothetical protein